MTREHASSPTNQLHQGKSNTAAVLKVPIHGRNTLILSTTFLGTHLDITLLLHLHSLTHQVKAKHRNLQEAEVKLFNSYVRALWLLRMSSTS